VLLAIPGDTEILARPPVLGRRPRAEGYGPRSFHAYRDPHDRTGWAGLAICRGPQTSASRPRRWA